MLRSFDELEQLFAEVAGRGVVVKATQEVLVLCPALIKELWDEKEQFELIHASWGLCVEYTYRRVSKDYKFTQDIKRYYSPGEFDKQESLNDFYLSKFRI